MTFGERLKERRVNKGLSQEKVAECLGVSRQAVTKWERNQTMPSSENLLALSSLYEISLDELAGNRLKGRRDQTILHSNLTRWAIIFQTAMLNVCIQPMSPEEYGLPFGFLLGFKLIPLAACSIWMVFNLRYEKNPTQYRKNLRIEFLYCSLQAVIAIAAYYSGFRLLGGIVLAAVCLTYIFWINPRYMGRILVKQKSRD